MQRRSHSTRTNIEDLLKTPVCSPRKHHLSSSWVSILSGPHWFRLRLGGGLLQQSLGEAGQGGGPRLGCRVEPTVCLYKGGLAMAAQCHAALVAPISVGVCCVQAAGWPAGLPKALRQTQQHWVGQKFDTTCRMRCATNLMAAGQAATYAAPRYEQRLDRQSVGCPGLYSIRVGRRDDGA